MSVMMEESFGPVIGIMPVDSEEEGVRLMNDSPYGLTASIWTEDAARGEALAARTAAGHGLRQPLRLPRPRARLGRHQRQRPRLHALAPWIPAPDASQEFSYPHPNRQLRSALRRMQIPGMLTIEDLRRRVDAVADRHRPADLHRHLRPPVRQAPGRPLLSGRRPRRRARTLATTCSPPTWRWTRRRAIDSPTGSAATAISTWPADLATLRVASWLDRTALVTCDVLSTRFPRVRGTSAALHPAAANRTSRRRWDTSQWPVPSWNITSSTTPTVRRPPPATTVSKPPDGTWRTITSCREPAKKS